MSVFGVRKGLLIKKTPTEKMGDIVVPQIHLASWDRPKVLKGLGEEICGSAGGASFSWRTLELGRLW